MVDKINKRKNMRNKIILSILALLIIFVTFLSMSYAYFSTSAMSEEQTVTTGNLSLKFDDNTSIIRNENIYPISRSQILTDATKKTFTIINTSDTDIYTILILEEMNLPDELRNVDFSWALYQNNVMKTTGTFNISKNSDKVFLTNFELLKEGLSKTYDLYIWIEESGVAQDSMQGKLFNATIVVNGLGTLGKNTVATVIKSKSTPNTTLPNFTTPSVNNGLFQTNTNTLNNQPTYYYRGNVTNNYLSFAGQLWRIVRINEDGSIRLILETNIGSKKYSSNTTCNLSNQTNCTTNYQISNIKTILDKWYSTTIKANSNLDSKVVTGKFCNDTSNTFVDRSASPTFDCTNVIESKVGTISADEVIYSGALYNSASNTTYLNNNASFYTMTSSSNSQVYIWNNSNTSLTNDANIFDYYDVRPVINLDSTTIITSGEGIINDPYIVN
ncbi:MAG: hypothetical protein IJO32_01560 [Bacilli bacterium]|nr:hypothetical protein [Bacilli bacterium]